MNLFANIIIGDNPFVLEIKAEPKTVGYQFNEPYLLIRHIKYENLKDLDCVETWHPTLEEAKDQANFEFPDLDIQWKEVQ